MHFFLNDIELNLTSGVITKEDQITHVRAKTLLVLKYLITNKERIVTKQELLTTIWHDVVVQEQVLVQSIKEIRNILGSDVIKTYPRQGYQWTAEVTELDEIAKEGKTKKGLFATLIITVLVVFLTIFYGSNKIEQSTPSLFTVAFLPIENDMPDAIHDWVPIEGMKYLNQSLKQQEKITVMNSEQLLKESSLVVSEKNGNEHIARLHEKYAADLVVQTKLLGYPQDFLLQYSLHLSHNIERGVLFSHDITDLLNQLSDLIITRYGQKNSDKKISYQSSHMADFSNEAYTRGINYYQQREYTKAIPFFTSAVEDNADFLAARRLLAASYVNSGDTEQGVSLMRKNIKLAKEKSKAREEIRSNLMLGVLFINSHELPTDKQENLRQAEQYIQQTKTLATQIDDKLFIAYAHEELGKIKRLQGLFEQAISLQEIALKIHDDFRGKYGQTTALIELARVSSAQQNFKLAEDYLHQAMEIATKNGVATNQVFVMLAQADIYHAQEQSNQANTVATQAMDIANAANNNFLKARVTAWLNKNPHYEIN